MFVAVHSFAVGTDTVYTARDAAKAVQESFADKSLDTIAPQVALVFMDSSFDHKAALKTIRGIVGRTVTIVGCTTAGDIGPQGPIKQQSISIMLLGGDAISVYASVEKHLERDSRKAGQRLGKTIRKKLHTPPALLLTFADGLTCNGSELITGITSELGDNTVIVGGNAADDESYQQTHQFIDTSVYTDAVVAVGIAGPLPFGVATAHGWLAVGLPKTITRVEGTTVKDIDGRPAIHLYEEYLGAPAAKSMRKRPMGEIALSYPLGVQQLDVATSQQHTLPRIAQRIDDDGGLVFSDSIPENTLVRLMVGNAPDALTAARTAATSALEQLQPHHPAAALVFASHVRRSLYTTVDEAAEEITAISEVIGSTSPLCGFYTYGEYAPLEAASPTNHHRHTLHNDNIVVLIFGSE